MNKLNDIIDALANYTLDCFTSDEYCDVLLLAGQFLCKYDKNTPMTEDDAVALVKQFYADEVKTSDPPIDDDDFDIDAELDEMLDEMTPEEVFDILMTETSRYD